MCSTEGTMTHFCDSCTLTQSNPALHANVVEKPFSTGYTWLLLMLTVARALLLDVMTCYCVYLFILFSF